MDFEEQLRREILAETPDASGLVSAVRLQIQREKRHFWLKLAAAALLTVGVGTTWLVTRQAKTGVLEAAARDHRVEVVQNKPRHWKMALQSMQPLLEQYHVGWSDVQALLPVGFVLEKAKECRIGGQPTLHLVFSDGKQALSVYVRAAGESISRAQLALPDEEAAGFRRGALSGIVVTAGMPGLCAEAVRRLTLL